LGGGDAGMSALIRVREVADQVADHIADSDAPSISGSGASKSCIERQFDAIYQE
jgi:hypothetical protein